MTSRRTSRRPGRSTPGQQTGGHRRHLLGAAVLAALLLGTTAALVPASTAAFTAQVTNGTSSVAAAPYFTCAAAITASSPRVYYKFNETGTATTAVDSSGQARNGTFQGTTITKGAAGACVRDSGTAVTFNGPSGYVNLATSLSVPTTYSVSAWFRTTSTTGGLIAGFGAAATGASSSVDRVLYLTNAGALVFGNNNTAKTTLTAAGPYRNGQWHHVLATVGPGGTRIYVNGTQAAASTATATATYTGFFRVGYDSLTGWPNAPSSSYLTGTLDEVAAFSTTLTAADAANQYQAGT